MNLVEHANARLADWPALTRGRACCGAQHCLCAGAREIVHFHGGCEVDVHLTHDMIDKLRPALRNSSALKMPTASGWITVRLETGSDIDLLATLVSVALLATGSRPESAESTRRDPCTRGFSEALQRRPGRRSRRPEARLGTPAVASDTDPVAVGSGTASPSARSWRNVRSFRWWARKRCPGLEAGTQPLPQASSRTR
ncbi:luciferase family protein [Streptomyces sp. NPDC050355]|uniref:luciferase domain-containing protein n=1 Tax=Streptomyces sp. NPDC050355 TaxID=3365609 RepID=UPI00379F1EDB